MKERKNNKSRIGRAVKSGEPLEAKETAQRFRTQRTPRAYYTGPALNVAVDKCPHCKSEARQRVVSVLQFVRLTRRYMRCDSCNRGWVKNTVKNEQHL